MESEIGIAVISSDDGYFHMISADPREISLQPIASRVLTIPLEDQAEADGIEAAAHELLQMDRRCGKWFASSESKAKDAVSEAVRAVREAFSDVAWKP